MSLSPLVSFKSRFVTYLLNFPRTYYWALLTLEAGVVTEKPRTVCLKRKSLPLGGFLFVLLYFNSSCFLSSGIVRVVTFHRGLRKIRENYRLDEHLVHF